MKADLEKRLRTYLAAGRRRQVPAGLKERILERTLGRKPRLASQLLAAAAIVALAVSLGIGLRQARLFNAKTANPQSTPTVVPSASAATYPLMPPVTFRMIDASSGWAGGEDTNRILHTADGGMHWNDVTPKSARPGSWIFSFLDARTAWLAASLGPGSGSSDFRVPIYQTTDGGRTWKQVGVVPATAGHASVIDFVDDRHGWLFMRLGGAAGSEGVAFYGTSDGGKTWTKLSEADSSGAEGRLPLTCFKNPPLFINSSTGWLPAACNPGNLPYLFVTRDGASTWSRVPLQVPAGYPASCVCSINDLHFANARNGDFVLDIYQPVNPPSTPTLPQDFVYTTQDGGLSWQLGPALPIPTPQLSFFDGTQGWAINARTNELLYTRDDGRHWSVVGTIPPSRVPMSLQFVTASVGWVLGPTTGGEFILSTVDGGKSWTTQLAPSG